MMLRQLRKTSRGSSLLRVLDVYVAPILVASLGIALLIASVATRLPSRSNLVAVEGELQSYEIVSRGRNGYVTVVSLAGQSSRFWTDAVTKVSAPTLLGPEPSRRGGSPRVKLFVERETAYNPIDGDAVKSYGLWIDGRAVRSVEAALQHDELIVRAVFPLLGLALLGLATFIHFRNRKRAA